MNDEAWLQPGIDQPIFSGLPIPNPEKSRNHLSQADRNR